MGASKKAAVDVHATRTLAGAGVVVTTTAPQLRTRAGVVVVTWCTTTPQLAGAVVTRVAGEAFPRTAAAATVASPTPGCSTSTN